MVRASGLKLRMRLLESFIEDRTEAKTFVNIDVVQTPRFSQNACSKNKGPDILLQLGASSDLPEKEQ